MKTLEFITKKYNLDLSLPSPIEIPNISRDNLAELFAELGFKKGAEIGTEQGLYAEILCKANPGLKLHCIDAWAVYPGYREHVAQGLIDKFHLEAKKRLSLFPCKVIKAFSIDAAKKLPDNSLDFVYIDANHDYGYVTTDLRIWSKKVRKGGIVSGHDYAHRAPGVVRATNDFTKINKITPWFIIGTEERIPGQKRDLSRSYMWVKK